MTYAPYESLVNGSYFPAIASSYDISLGGNGFFYVFAYFGILVTIALTTESPAPVGVFALVGGVVFYELIPTSFHTAFYAIAVLSVAITLYKLFVHKRGSAI